jgi:hypothetical protein
MIIYILFLLCGELLKWGLTLPTLSLINYVIVSKLTSENKEIINIKIKLRKGLISNGKYNFKYIYISR